MKASKRNVSLFWIIVAIVASSAWLLGEGASSLAAQGVQPLDPRGWDNAAGVNGSFEHTNSGLPVNWHVYTQKRGTSGDFVTPGDFDIRIDTKEFKDGKQSLNFVVRKCSDKGGWFSPGIHQEWKAKPGETFKVSFWAKNAGCEFWAKVGAVSAREGQMETVVRSNEKFGAWRHFEHKYTVPKKLGHERPWSIRFELNVLSPGSFWIDDVQIDKVTG